jgi:hypothetical protein
MAGVAQRDQVVFVVLTGVTAELLMMDFEVGHRAATLASPPA